MNKKPPCVECKRHFTYYDRYDGLTRHYCRSNRRSSIDDDYYAYSCWWYRRTPFCKFEYKEQ